MSRCNVAIVGCGLGGAAAAVAIQKAGHQVTIFEQAQGLNEIGAGIQLPYNCTRILDRWGILPIVESHAVRPSNVVLRSYKDGRVLFKRSLPALNEARTEIPHLLIRRADFLKTLVNEATRLGAMLQFSTRITAIDFTKPAIQFASGDTSEFDILFGADGLHSHCRQQLIGNYNSSPQLSDHTAYRITVPVGDIENDETLSDLLQDYDTSCWMGPGRHAVCYQLKQGSLLNLVLVGPNDIHRADGTIQSEEQQMEAVFVDCDPRLRRIFRLAKNVLKTRLQSSHELVSWSHPAGKFALVGDACHASLPYLAQGAAQAVEDGAVLGRLLSKMKQKYEIKDLVRTYEAIRKPRTSRVIAGSEARGVAYHLPDGKAQQDRDWELTHARQGDAYPQCMEDLAFQSWLLHYDVDCAVEEVWN